MSHWRTVRIADFCRTGTGGTPSRSDLDRYYEGGTIPWVKSGELRENIINETEEHVTEAALRETNVKLVPPGALLLAMYGATVGRLGILGIEATTNQAVCHIIPDPKAAEIRFLFYALSNQVSNLIARGVGGAQPNINQGIVKDLVLALPPLPEQRRIADVLDRAESLRVKRRAALAELDSLTQSIFLDMFGDPATNPKGWPKKILGEVAREKPNNGIFRKNPEYIHEGQNGLPVVWVEELFRGDSIDTKNSRRVIPVESETVRFGLKTGDILFCRSSLKLDGIAFNNVYLGKDNDALFECHLIRISPDMKIVSPIYLNCLLRLPQMRAIAKSKSKTATMTTIDQQSLCSIELPLPPIEMQHKFSRRMTAVEKLKAAQRASLAELDELFASLQYRAFTGKL